MGRKEKCRRDGRQRGRRRDCIQELWYTGRYGVSRRKRSKGCGKNWIATEAQRLRRKRRSYWSCKCSSARRWSVNGWD